MWRPCAITIYSRILENNVGPLAVVTRANLEGRPSVDPFKYGRTWPVLLGCNNSIKELMAALAKPRLRIVSDSSHVVSLTTPKLARHPYEKNAQTTHSILLESSDRFIMLGLE